MPKKSADGPPPRERGFLILFAIAHHVFLLIVGVLMGMAGINIGFQHWQDARQAGQNPISDPYVQGAVPLVLFALLVILIFIARVFVAVQRAKRRIQQERLMS